MNTASIENPEAESDARLDDCLHKLRKLRMSGMANAFIEQLSDPANMALPFEERFMAVVDAEYSLRASNKLRRMVAAAHLKYPFASIDSNPASEPERAVDYASIAALASCDWIDKRKNVIITGATGVGKTYLACALGICALQKFIRVLYSRASELVYELEKADSMKDAASCIERYAKTDLLIIDDFGLMPSLSIDRCRLFLDVLDARAGMRSTIIAAQIPVSSWYGLFADSTFADACMERMIKSAYRIELKGSSLRS